MKSDKKKFNVLTDGAGAYWVGEGERIKTSKATWIHPEMEAKKLAVIIPVTKEKLEDTTINVFNELKDTIAEAFYKAIDGAGIFGTNSPFKKNILKSATDAGNIVQLGTNGDGHLDLDVSDAMALVEEEDLDVTSFVARKGIKNSLRKLRDANGNQLFVDGVNGQELYNNPIEFAQKGAWDKTKAELIGGDFKTYSLVGIRDGLSYEILKEATLEGTVDEDGKPISLAEQDMIAIKATMRLGYLPVKDEAFCVITPKKEVVKYTVTYDANGGTGSIASVQVEAGKSITLSDGTGLTAPTGKTFKGWAKSNTAQNSSVESPFTPTKDTTLYAVYGE